MRGQQVCRMHGGSSPQARRTARQRLAELAEPAVAALSVALESGDIHAVIKAAIAVLDRCGLGPRSTVELENVAPRTPPPDWLLWATSEEARTVRSIIQAAEGRRDAGEPPARINTDDEEDKNP